MCVSVCLVCFVFLGFDIEPRSPAGIFLSRNFHALLCVCLYLFFMLSSFLPRPHPFFLFFWIIYIYEYAGVLVVFSFLSFGWYHADSYAFLAVRQSEG